MPAVPLVVLLIGWTFEGVLRVALQNCDRSVMSLADYVITPIHRFRA
jgi:hypothetical protein